MKVTVTVGDDGTFVIEDDIGNKKTVKGLLIVGHNSETKELYLVPGGNPVEVATGLGEGLARGAQYDPYYVALYKAIAADMMLRTGALTTGQRIEIDQIDEHWPDRGKKDSTTH